MIDIELKKYLENIELGIRKLDKRRWWKALVEGIMRGFGSIFGIVLALVFIGWMLKLIGIIPSFRQEVEQWRKLLQETQRTQIQLPNQIDQTDTLR